MNGASDRMWGRIGALSGIVGMVLNTVGFMLIGAGGGAPRPGASAEAIAKIVAEPVGTQVLVGRYVGMLGALLLVVFAARLYGSLRRAEGDPGWLSAASFGSALVFFAGADGAGASLYALSLGAGQGLDVQGATALVNLNVAFFAGARAFGALWLLMTAVVIVRRAELPVWLGWASAVIGVVMLVGLAAPPTVAISQLPFLFFILWIFATSVALMREPGRSLATPGATAAARP